MKETDRTANYANPADERRIAVRGKLCPPARAEGADEREENADDEAIETGVRGVIEIAHEWGPELVLLSAGSPNDVKKQPGAKQHAPNNDEAEQSACSSDIGLTHEQENKGRKDQIEMLFDAQ